MDEQLDLDRAPLSLQQPRWKRLFGLLFVAALIFAFIQRWHSLAATSDKVLALAMIALLGWLSAMGAAGLVRPSRLTIGPSGLSLRTAFRTRYWKWTEIGEIQPVASRGFTAVEFVSEHPPPLARALARLMRLSYNDGLPSGWSVEASVLSKLLNDAKARWN